MKRFALGVVVLVLGVVPVYATTIYSVTDLGDLPGGEDSSQAFAVNNWGQVVGVSSILDGRRPFLYSNGVLTDLGVLEANHRYSMATDINDLGEVSGRSMIDESVENTQSLRPFLYRNGAMMPLGSLGGGYGFANSLNNLSEVVGLSSDANGVTHAFLWSNGAMSDLGSLEGGGNYSCAYGINDNTQVVGTSFLRGFLWQNGQISDLGDLSGGSGSTLAFAVNDLGQVVGYSGPLDSEQTFPFIWQDGVMEYLGSLSDPTPSGYARGINNLGEVVGVVSGYSFIWDSVNGMQDLNELLDESGDGWQLTHAYDINDRRQIVGFGRNPSGFSHGFLLTPIPQCSSITIGKWNLASTWNDGIIPSNDYQAVVGGHTVTLAEDDGHAHSVLIHDSGVVAVGTGRTLTVVNDVEVVDGTLGIAPTATLNVSGSLVMQEGSRYVCELRGPDGGMIAASDAELNEGSALTLRASGRLTAPDGAPVHGDLTRTILTTSGREGIKGVFTDVPTVGDFSLPWWDRDRYGDYLGYGVWFGNDKTGEGVTYVEDGGVVTAVAISVFQALEGDTDGDRDIDFGDFNNLANGYTGALDSGIGGKEWHDGDFDGDGDVDFADFNYLANHYTGVDVEYASSKLAVVPEPGTFTLLVGGALGLLVWRRRRRAGARRWT